MELGFGQRPRVKAARYQLQLRQIAKMYLGKKAYSEAAWHVMIAFYTLQSSERGCSVRTIAQRADMPRNTTLRNLLRLESAGFLTMQPDKNDKRAIRVQITPGGRDVVKRIFDVAETGHSPI